ncbi:MAG TPA: protein kinase [Pyrinomonadaceae bacterium]|nr:protein kinase [Pyrinomonadaceae bacterium]
MTPERYQRIGRLFDEALDLAPEQRAGWLDQACGADTGLRAEVENLIANHVESEEFLSRPALDIAAALLAQNQHASLLGQKLSHYQILSLLGVGGMGEVYLAQDTQLGRRVALKVLAPELRDKKEQLQRLEQEARAASALNHPNILTIYEIGEANEVRFIAAEYVGGETLRECLRRERFTVSETLDIAMQIVAALEAAHQAGIVHRDVKPENVILRKDGLVKLLDFGIAKLAERPVEDLETEAPTRALVKTSPGMMMGTVSYMSPEQVRGQTVDGRADEWSLGVMLYEMLTGRLPFAGETVSDAIAAILKTEAEPPTNFNSEIPVELGRIVLKTLRKDAGERYQHIKNLLIDLRDLKQDLEFESKLKRTSTQDGLEAPSASWRVTAEQMPARGSAPNSLPTTSTAEYLVSEIKQHRRGVLLGLAILLTVAIAAVYFGYSRYFHEAGGVAIDSIAVVPFVNQNGDVTTEYLQDGLTESIIISLSRLPQLRVMARGTMFRYKGRDVDPQAVGKELGVRAVLTGRVLQQGDNLIISAELVNVADGAQLWGEQYSRRTADLLAMQQEIARQISSRLQLRLSGEEQRHLNKGGTSDNEAYQIYLRGRYSWNKRTAENIRRAIEQFQQAIDKDPNYALAYVGLADAYAIMPSYAYLSPKEAIPQAKAAAQRALEIDPTLAEAHAALAFSLSVYDWNWMEAEREFKRALELNSNVAEIHFRYGLDYLGPMGRTDEMITEIKRALELEPLSLATGAALSGAYLFARQYDRALEEAKKAYDLDPNFVGGRIWLGYIYANNGMYTEAIELSEKSLQTSPTSQPFLRVAGYAYAKSGRRREAEEVIRKFKDIAKTQYVASYYVASIYTALSERDEAFAELEKAYAERDYLLPRLKIDPFMDPLRDDPRFKDLVRRMGLPQ